MNYAAAARESCYASLAAAATVVDPGMLPGRRTGASSVGGSPSSGVPSLPPPPSACGGFESPYSAAVYSRLAAAGSWPFCDPWPFHGGSSAPSSTGPRTGSGSGGGFGGATGAQHHNSAHNQSPSPPSPIKRHAPSAGPIQSMGGYGGNVSSCGGNNGGSGGGAPTGLWDVYPTCGTAATHGWLAELSSPFAAAAAAGSYGLTSSAAAFVDHHSMFGALQQPGLPPFIPIQTSATSSAASASSSSIPSTSISDVVSPSLVDVYGKYAVDSAKIGSTRGSGGIGTEPLGSLSSIHHLQPESSLLLPQQQRGAGGGNGSTTTSGSRAAGSGSQRRGYASTAGRPSCSCPNCQEIDRLGPAGEYLRKTVQQHCCHVPGCGKVGDVCVCVLHRI